MEDSMKKISAWLLVLCMMLGLMSSFVTADETTDAGFTGNYKGSALPFTELTAEDMTRVMGTGWNLNGVFDASNTYVMQQSMEIANSDIFEVIDWVSESGFSTLRIPITWTAAIDDSHGTSIDSAWLAKVREAVDYALSKGLFVIINLESDSSMYGGWLHLGEANFSTVKTKYISVWKKIAATFKNYDEHLLFEAMNDICATTDTAKDAEEINELNHSFISVVRSTGANNEQRWLILSGLDSEISGITASTFTVPEDAGNVMVSFHYSDDFSDAKNTGVTTYSSSQIGTLAQSFSSLAQKYIAAGIPVVLSEYGSADKDNTEERAYHEELINVLCKQTGVIPVYMGTGADTSMFGDGSLLVNFPEIVDAILRGSQKHYEKLADVQKTPAGTEQVTMTLSEEEVTLMVGDYVEVTDESTGDYVVWTSANPSVATVNAGRIYGKSVGTTVITAASGDLSIELTVHVNPNVTVAYQIQTASDSAELTAGDSIYLNPSLSDSMGIAKEDDSVIYTYCSSNRAVATVNDFGLVNAVAEGTAYITVSGSMGTEKTVKITVDGGSKETASAPEITASTIGLGQTVISVTGVNGAAYLVSGSPESLSVLTPGGAEYREDGTVNFTVYGVKDGSAELTVYPENGDPVTKMVLISSTASNTETETATVDAETQTADSGNTDKQSDDDSKSDDSSKKTSKTASEEEVGYTAMTGKTYVILVGIILVLGAMAAGIVIEVKKQKK